MTTVLMTGIGGDIAQGIARIVAEEFPDWRIVGSDTQKRHAGGLYAHTILEAPPANEHEYLDWLLQTVRELHADFLLPLTEPELRSIHGNIGRFSGSTRLIFPGEAALRVGLDKLRTSEFLTKIGLPNPWTTAAVSEVSPHQWPCIYKPRHGSGSRSIFVCNNKEDGRYLAERFPGGIFQELLLPAEGEVTCGVFRSRAGQTSVLQLLRQLTGGLTGWAQVICESEVEEQCRAVAEQLGVVGSINIQLRLTGSGPRIFEINPRFSSTSLMRHRIGFQDVLWSLHDAIGQPFHTKIPDVGLTMVRTFDAKILHGAGTRIDNTRS